MIAEPTPTIVTVVPEIVATAVLLDTKVKAPVAFDVGAVNVNAASPNVLLIAAIDPMVGVALPTVINPDIELVAVEQPPVATA